MKLPAQDKYKDIHGGMSAMLPDVTSKNIEDYASIHDAKWTDKVPALYKTRSVCFSSHSLCWFQILVLLLNIFAPTH